MSISAVILPVLVQVGLTLLLLLWMGRTRVGHLRRGEVKVQDIVLGERNWPKQVTRSRTRTTTSSSFRCCSMCSWPWR